MLNVKNKYDNKFKEKIMIIKYKKKYYIKY